MTILLWVLIALVTLLNIADIYTTKKGLDMGMFEKNVLMLLIINNFGSRGLIIVKGLVVAIVINLALWILPELASVCMLAGVNIFYACIVWHNYKLIS